MYIIFWYISGRWISLRSNVKSFSVIVLWLLISKRSNIILLQYNKQVKLHKRTLWRWWKNFNLKKSSRAKIILQNGWGLNQSVLLIELFSKLDIVNMHRREIHIPFRIWYVSVKNLNVTRKYGNIGREKKW